MDNFSLEDNDSQSLFITQSSNSDISNIITGDPSDFSSPCVSLLSQREGDDNAHYSDISDDDFEIPSSQIPTNSSRSVLKLLTFILIVVYLILVIKFCRKIKNVH